MKKQPTKKAPTRKAPMAAKRTTPRATAKAQDRTYAIDLTPYGIPMVKCLCVGPRKPTKDMVEKVVRAMQRRMARGSRTAPATAGQRS